jgi:hypothetical protein
MTGGILHLLSGELARENVALAAVPGNIHSIDDILMEGPVVNGLSSDDDWQFRARFIDKRFAVPARRYLSKKASRDHLLARVRDFDETVLWFEPDLFCQINHLYLLDWFASRAPFSTKLSVADASSGAAKISVCRMATAEIRELFERRRPVSSKLLQLGKASWVAYSARTPFELTRLVTHHDFSAWPELRRGLELHLRRFPGETGLNFLETFMLTFVDAMGPSGVSIGQLINRFATESDTRDYGLGDVQIIAQLNELAHKPGPLVAPSGRNISSMGADLTKALAFRANEATSRAQCPNGTRFILTARGRAVLEGTRKFERRTDRWLGGVQLPPGPDGWRWDDALRTMVQL